MVQFARVFSANTFVRAAFIVLGLGGIAHAQPYPHNAATTATPGTYTGTLGGGN